LSSSAPIAKNRDAVNARRRARYEANREAEIIKMRARRYGVTVEELEAMPEAERLARLAAMPTYLYRWFAYNTVNPDGGHDELIYVGISTDVDRRTAQHLKRYEHDNSTWPHWADRVEVELFPDRACALAAEADAIKTEFPRSTSLVTVCGP
jgi:predicted GIY-YIG superfamily endonuclease